MLGSRCCPPGCTNVLRRDSTLVATRRSCSLEALGGMQTVADWRRHTMLAPVEQSNQIYHNKSKSVLLQNIQ